MRQRREFTLLVLLAGLSLGGCFQSSTHGTVNGTVNVDSKPLQAGTVRFVPVDGASQTASAMVSEGKFTATVPVGLMRVEFSGSKVMGRQKMYNTPNSPKVDMVIELLPPRYNVQSELTLDVQAGPQDAPFKLFSR